MLENSVLPDLLPNARGRSPLNFLWVRPESPGTVAREMVRPRRFLWVLAVAPPAKRGAPAYYESSAVVGVLERPGGLGVPVACRPTETASTRLAEMRAQSGVFIRTLRFDDPDPTEVAAEMLRDWQRGVLRNEPLRFRELIT